VSARGQSAKLLVAVGLSAAGLTGCGGVGENTIVVRVDGHAYSKRAVDHWANVIRRGGAFVGFRGAPPHGTPKQRAVTLLITSNWLTEEAARHGVGVQSATRQALEEREQGPDLQKRLRATGETLADAKLEIEAELAAEAIREKLAMGAAQFTPLELSAFYRANASSFSTLEVRVTDLIENLPTPTAAEALIRRIGTGARFTKRAIRESVSRTPGYMSTPEKSKAVKAIFAARPGIASRPVRLNEWTVFVVRKVVPPAPKPLASVRAEVARSFDVQRQHEIAARFDREYLARGHAVTSCHSGWVAAGCPQDKGALASYEDPFSRRAHPLLSEQVLSE
jgi:hypothetical protein